MKHTKTWGVRLFETGNLIFFTLVAILALYPFWQVLMISFVSEGEYYRRVIILWPEEPIWQNYLRVFWWSDVGRAFFNSVVSSLVGTLYSLTVTLAMAYALSIKTLPGRRGLMLGVLVAMFFSGGLIPFYLQIKNLGLIGNPLVLVLPYAVNCFYLIMAKAFFEQFPEDLRESARMDGAGDIRIFAQIVLPNSAPLIATLFFYYLVFYWNNWYNNLLFLTQTPEYQTMPYVLQGLISNMTGPISAAALVLGIAPIAVVVPLMRRFYLQGTFIGSIKG